MANIKNCNASMRFTICRLFLNSVGDPLSLHPGVLQGNKVELQEEPQGRDPSHRTDRP